MIKTWGQTPKQIFLTNHPQSLGLAQQTQQVKKSSSLTLYGAASNSSISAISYPNSSIHSLIFNIKWGTYVGSLEQSLPPVCVYKESCKKNIVSLISLPSNDVIGLSQFKSLLLERPKETSL